MMRLRLFLTNILLLCALVVLGYDRATYYSDANGKSGAQLKTALYGIMGTPTVKSYSSLWTHYYDTDRLSNNQVVDRYSNTKRYFSGQNGNAVSGMNKEHGIPQSWWGGGTTGIGSDLQHVMPSDTEANSRKSNFGMGIVTNQTWTNGSIKVGKGTAGNNGTVSLWEPADEWKGDFARIYFYIVTAYEQKSLVQQEGANSMQSNTYPKLQPWAYTLYMQWSRDDPVSDLERERNEAVYKIQGNRNPFIDFEGLEQYIWGSMKDQGISVSNYENPYGGDTPGPRAPEISFAVQNKTLNQGDTYTQTVTTTSSGAVTYTSSDPLVAMVDAQSGLVTALTEGTTTITASVAATSVYLAATTSYVITVLGHGEDPQPADGSTYVRVESNLSNWAGTYLIVYEGESVAMDGGLEEFDKASNNISVDIRNGVIDVTSATQAAEFVVASLTGNKYSVRGRSGKYMGCTASKNTVDTSDSPLACTFSVASGDASISGESGNVLRFNSQKGQKRFRFYKSGQEPVALYRRTEKTVGIGQVSEVGSQKPDDIYDLQGRRIKEVKRPGVYIVQGKKVVLR